MERWIGKIAIVTGASAGIGEAIVRAFVGAGIQVVGLARRENRIQEIADSLKGAKGKLYAVKCDLRNENDILKAFEWTNEKLGGVDVLVNNAGVAVTSTIAEGTTEDYRKILDVNLLAVAICTREAIKSMRSRNTEGHIFYLNSVLGYNATLTSLPTGLYPAGKFALRGLIDNVRQEIERTADNIRTTSIIPGLVRTEIFNAAGGSDVIFDRMPSIQAKDIADGVMYALSAAPFVRVDEVKITPLRQWTVSWYLILDKMERWSGKVAIVTGASSGIGAAITEELVKHGVKVVGAARRLQKVRDLAAKLKGQKGSVYAIECDVKKEQDILKVFKWVEKELGGVDIVINNAGVYIRENIMDASTESYRHVMDTNLLAPAIFAREAIRSMKKRKSAGHIITIGSIGGHNPEGVTVPCNLYVASKCAVVGMCHTLRNEIGAARLNIKITSLSPGAVKTDMILDVGFTLELMERLPILTPEEIASAVIFALSTPPNVQVKELIVEPLAPLHALLAD
ncbi:11-beta-hydroxysteroid dehydrogenase 1A-like [Venturia canescens]|uniref:11-beta-hydroxysteroid dehydrogenase 1A-like n=1 Tax=Venturia canescens TaxID=32260 RepID=UPI001C9C23DD|nr:11-beta-hydroxysteroid dehydrogenase 1A-like [Venturia canescens]